MLKGREQMRNKPLRDACLAVSLAALAIAWTAAATAQPAGWKPGKNVEIIVPTSPGGGADRTGRTIQRILQGERWVESATVANRPGGGGAIGLNYLHQQSGDPHFLLIHSEPLVTNRIMGRNPLDHSVVTPIALLTFEDLVYTVRADSPIKDGRDLLEMLRKDPTSVSMSVGSAIGNNSHMATGLVGKTAGINVQKLKLVTFKSGGEARTALLGGHIDLFVSTLTPVMQHIESGKLRAIAVTSERRLGGEAAGIPTWKEQGVDVSFATWRVAVAAKDITPAQVAFWDETFARLAKSEEWTKDFDRFFLRNAYQNSAGTRKFLAEQETRLQGILSALGLAKD
jgi:putative tricarboxylic transport membrane protein